MEQSAVLKLVNSKHSKQYSVFIAGAGDGYVVNFTYGAIGAPQKSGTKTPQPVSLAMAQKVYDKLIAEKAGKRCECCGGSYSPSEVAPIASRPSATVAKVIQISGGMPTEATFEPELLEAIDVHTSGRLINSEQYGVMKKYDGHRQAIRKTGGLVQAYNRLGKRIDPDDDVVRFVGSLANDVMLDGEFVQGHFVAFDLLELNGQDMRTMAFEDRWDLLADVCGNRVLVAPLAVGKDSIMALIQAEHDTRGEGVVFKRLDAKYMPGRQGTNKKFKFWVSATFRVCAKQKTAAKALAHSFGVEVLKGGEWIYCGSVTCKGPLPEIGTYREVKYLYLGAQGNVYQPEDWGAREDVTDADCGYAQLKLKQGEEHAI